MANQSIQIKRFNGSSWDELYPRTKISNLFEIINNNEYSLTENNKIRERFLPDYLLGQMVYAGIIVTEKSDSTATGYVSENYKQGFWVSAGFFTKVIVNLTDAGKAKIIANNSDSTITWNSTYPNKAILYYSSVPDVDVGENLDYPVFTFSDCSDCYFIFQNPHGHTAGESYGLFADAASAQDPVPFLNDVVAGDWIVATASGWGKIDNTDAVISVNNKRGQLTLYGTDIAMSNQDSTTVSAKIATKANSENPEFTGTITTSLSSGLVKSTNGVLGIDTNTYALSGHTHNITSIIGPHDSYESALADHSEYLIPINSGSAQQVGDEIPPGTPSSWLHFSSLPVVTGDRNGLMSTIDKVALNTFRAIQNHNATPYSTFNNDQKTAHVGDVAFFALS